MTKPGWDLWRSFLAALRGGSLSEAARQVRATQPTLGRHIAELERCLGMALFTRSASGLRPTAAALALRPHAEAMEAAAGLLQRTAVGGADTLRGLVRLTASAFFGGAVLPPMLAAFGEAHPGIEVELSLSNRTEDLLRGDADLAVRNVQPRQAALVVQRLGEVPVGLFASRAYVARHGVPETLDALGRHRLVGWPEHAERAGTLGVPGPRFALRCESDFGLLGALRAGAGIGYCQVSFARREPDLVAVLPDLVVARLGVWLAMHEDLRATPQVRALFDHLAQGLKTYLSEPAP